MGVIIAVPQVYASHGDGYTTPESIRKVFRSKYPRADPDSVFGPESEYDTGRMVRHLLLLKNYDRLIGGFSK